MRPQCGDEHPLAGDGRPQGGDGRVQGADAVVIDLVLGSVTRHTLDAGALERAHGRSVGAWLETEANPFLSHRPPPPSPADPGPPPRVTDLTGAPVWFVPGLVQTPEWVHCCPTGWPPCSTIPTRGCGSSTAPRGRRMGGSRSGAPIVRMPLSRRRCERATGTAASRGARSRPGGATSTTSWPFRQGRPRRRICRRSAPRTTASSTTPAGV